jgi:hypothetical protein
MLSVATQRGFTIPFRVENKFAYYHTLAAGKTQEKARQTRLNFQPVFLGISNRKSLQLEKWDLAACLPAIRNFTALTAFT